MHNVDRTDQGHLEPKVLYRG